MPETDMPDADTVYEYRGRVKLLRETPYRSAYAQLPDDGIIDEIAVERFAHGDPVRLSPREIVCAVLRLAADGHSDERISRRFRPDVPERTGRTWISELRDAHRITAGQPRSVPA